MTDKLRAAAKAALETLDCGGRNYSRAAHILRAALAEPAIKESLTVRPWVGLTDEEIARGNKESWVTEQAWQSAVWWAEAKLREKNT